MLEIGRRKAAVLQKIDKQQRICYDVYSIDQRKNEVEGYEENSKSVTMYCGMRSVDTASGQSPRNVGGGTANVNVGIKTGDFIYYGKDCKWRVLDAEAGNAVGAGDSLSDGQETVANDQAMFVISEACMGTGEYGEVQFNETMGKGNAYQGSDAQRWCEDFTKNQLTAEEQSALLAVTKDDSECNVNEELYSASENILNGDRIFFLSAEEANTYFDDKGDRVADYNGADGGWWLRSPSSVFSSNAGLINMYGGISKSNVSNDWAARPAFDLNRNAVLFSSAASGGKSSGEAGVDAWKRSVHMRARNGS